MELEELPDWPLACACNAANRFCAKADNACCGSCVDVVPEVLAVLELLLSLEIPSCDNASSSAEANFPPLAAPGTLLVLEVPVLLVVVTGGNWVL